MSIISLCKVYHILFKHHSITSKMVSINVGYFAATVDKGCYYLLSLSFLDGRTLWDSWRKTMDQSTERSAQQQTEDVNRLVKVTVVISVPEPTIHFYPDREMLSFFCFPTRRAASLYVLSHWFSAMCSPSLCLLLHKKGGVKQPKKSTNHKCQFVLIFEWFISTCWESAAPTDCISVCCSVPSLPCWLAHIIAIWQYF